MLYIASTLLIRDNKILLHLRDDKNGLVDANRWSVIGGAMEEGETPKEALKREVKEEVGFDISNPKYLCDIKHDYRGTNTVIHLFETEIDKDIDELVLTEGQAIKYFDLDEINDIEISPYFKDIIINKLKELND